MLSNKEYFSNHTQEDLTKIDWLSFTFLPPKNYDKATYHNKIIDDLVWLGLSSDFKDQGRGWNSYKNCIEAKGVCKICFGGNAVGGTYYVSLTGQGCSLVNDWSNVQIWLRSLKAKIKRVDCAYDDFLGENITLLNVRDWYRNGLFKTGGRNPVGYPIGDFDIPNPDNSLTFYVGRRENSKFLRIYEKGKKEKATDLPNWVRIELELKSKKNDYVPYNVLSHPLAYIKGAYPKVFSFLPTTEKKIIKGFRNNAIVEASKNRHIYNIKKQYGSHINQLHNSYGMSIASIYNAINIPKVSPSIVNTYKLAKKVIGEKYE